MSAWADVVLGPAIERSEIEAFTPRDLRRTAASIAVATGASVLAVQKMLGHKDAAMTLNVYADLFDADAQDLADRLSRLASAAAGLAPAADDSGTACSLCAHRAA